MKKKDYVNLHYEVKDENGFLIDKRKKFSTFLDAIKFVRENKMNMHSRKPTVDFNSFGG